MLRTAVIGVGVMGQNHIRILKEVSSLVGVCDSDPKAGSDITRKLDIPRSQDLHGFLEFGGFDAVVIATPTVTHREVALACINAGKHVLVEKPLASTATDAYEIHHAAEKAGVVLAVGHIERYNPVVAAAKKLLLEKKAVGEPISLSSRRVGPFPWRIKDVGAVIDLAVHDIDIARYLAGSGVVSVYAAGGSKVHKMEDYATVVLTFENGITAAIEVNWLTPVKIRKLCLTCTLRHMELDYIDQTIGLSSSTVTDLDPANLSHIPLESDHHVVRLKKQEPLKLEILDFIGAIEEKRPPLVGGDDGAAAVLLAADALKSLETGRASKNITPV
jgi:UDP-N-acetylglucosamine 3-dehydrogenase